jgi:hypothetical protein
VDGPNKGWRTFMMEYYTNIKKLFLRLFQHTSQKLNIKTYTDFKIEILAGGHSSSGSTPA